MKMTSQQFKEWSAGATWSEEEILLHEDPARPYYPAPAPGRCLGEAAKLMTATLPDGSELTVVYQQLAEWAGDIHHRVDCGYTAIYFADWINTECFIQSGDFDLVADGGETLARWAVCDVLKACVPGLTTIDYNLLLPAVGVAKQEA